MTGKELAILWWLIGSPILVFGIVFVEFSSRWDSVKRRKAIGMVTWGSIYKFFQVVLVLSIAIPLKWFVGIASEY